MRTAPHFSLPTFTTTGGKVYWCQSNYVKLRPDKSLKVRSFILNALQPVRIFVVLIPKFQPEPRTVQIKLQNELKGLTHYLKWTSQSNIPPATSLTFWHYNITSAEKRLSAFLYSMGLRENIAIAIVLVGCFVLTILAYYVVKPLYRAHRLRQIHRLREGRRERRERREAQAAADAAAQLEAAQAAAAA